MRSGKRIGNLEVVLEDTSVPDFVETWYSEWIIQDDVLRDLRQAGLTGFEVKPTTASFKKSKEPTPIFWEVIVTGWGGMASPASGIALDEENSCSACGMLRYKQGTNPANIISSDNWDGSDFFMVWPLPNYKFVSGKAAKFIKEKKYTGCKIIPARELAFSNRVMPGFGPDRLSHYMPSDRARELGDPLGIY